MTSSPDDLERRLGRHLRQRRIEADLTQVELADTANVSVGALRHLENGEGANVTTLARVVIALGAESWIDDLALPDPGFSPLAVLSRQRESAAAADPPRPRVRRARRVPAS